MESGSTSREHELGPEGQKGSRLTHFSVSARSQKRSSATGCKRLRTFQSDSLISCGTVTDTQGSLPDHLRASSMLGLALLHFVPASAAANIVPTESYPLVVVWIERQDALKYLSGVLKLSHAPEAQSVTVQTAQKRPVVN